MKFRKVLFIRFCVVILLSLSNTASSRETADPNREQSANVTEWSTSECLLEPNMVIHLSSPVIGVISTINVDRGERVSKGEAVVKLSSTVELAAVNLKRAQYAFSRTTVKRNKELFEQKLISTQERDEIILDSEISRLELASARAHLQQKTIHSPISGVVLERLMDPGEYVGEAPVLSIASLNPLYVEAVLNKELFGNVRIDDRVNINLEAPLKGDYSATVVVVDPVIDPASGTFSIRMKLDNPDSKIPAGLKCLASFHSRKPSGSN